MKIEDYRKNIDIFMTLLIAYFFILAMSFQYIQAQGQFENYIMLSVVMIVAVISYYTGVTFSLVVVLAAEFIYCSYKFYMYIVNAVSIDPSVYYWVAAIPITALLISFLSKYIVDLQVQSVKVDEESKSLVMIDPLTGIRNSSALFNELPIYMSMSRRYSIPVALMVVKFRYNNKLKSIVGDKFFKNIIADCSNILENSLRIEDRKYILKDNDTFVFILISDESGCEVVKKRFKENIESVNIDKHDIFNNLKLEIQVGYCIYNESIEDAMTFLSTAEMEIDYDV